MPRSDNLIPINQASHLDHELPDPGHVPQRYAVAKLMAERKFDPIARMIDLAEELEAVDREAGAPVMADKRMKLYTTLAKYYAPQPKAIDINVTSEHSSTLQVISFSDLVKERQHMIPEQAQYAGPSLAMMGATEIAVEPDPVRIGEQITKELEDIDE